MLFGSSGIRGKYNLNLADIALKAGSVLGSGSPDIIVGIDTRTTSPILAHLVTAGILGSGGSVRSAGIVPTPTVAFCSRLAQAGCMITASHNPEDYNGLKLFNRDGSSFTKKQQAETEELLGACHWTDWKHQGHEHTFDAITPHIKAILDGVDIPHGGSAVLDCGNGAGSTLTPSLLSDAGVKTTCINCNPSGHFGRPSEPLEENVSYLGEIVKKTGARCAVVHDGDADRMMAFDNRGRYISGDHLLVLFARYLGAKQVVTTSDASMIIEDTAEVRRTPVGDAYVSEELLKWGDFGGEPSGAWIFPKISYCPDGPFAATLFCEMSSEWDIAQEIDEIPSYPLIRESYHCENARDILLSLGASSPTDGIRMSGEDGWYLIRASGTEPKIRITAEGKTPAKAKELLTMGKERIQKGKTP
ncbi:MULTISPECIES: phosphopentomutase/phosphoglucosamine mutase [unclassified Methanoregula]|uniref:phosphopentomutase/phosphoglucosamine mutase n=1 Tax=unclassified Methanoregula TaxID=2649730 RepID=UPI0009C8ECB4|nr:MULTISPECIES: phosphopentomutase/phosphoglucosamine mutase [unclassified Methanoregula]OPX61701.1 MAG: Phosphoglucosamine mutase [Methanoregula sp. PtaB.Bin085]OPY33990.1 MAG: Phosphoglucosamine mutase [Methanoregula sp. PtaU1.Bin006]